MEESINEILLTGMKGIQGIEGRLADIPHLGYRTTMSGATAEIVEVCEALPEEKRSEVIDFARFLLSQVDEHRWESLISDTKPRPRLEEFLKASAQEADEALDPAKL
jgi:hypothetical protein